MRGRELAVKYKVFLDLWSSYYKFFPAKILCKKLEKIRYKSGKVAAAKRYCILKNIAMNIGQNVLLKEACYVFSPERISIGDNVSIQPQCYLEGFGGITIGSDVSIAHGVSIISVTHNYDDNSVVIKDQGLTPQPISIGSNVWIGAKATILGNVRIGDNVIIGAGAVVTKDVESDCIATGIPAKMRKRMYE